MADPCQASALLAEMSSGHRDALPRLLPAFYPELRRLAGRYMRDERRSHTLQPTALVHEAYIRLAGQDRATWRNRAQFMSMAGQFMRRILVDYARRRHSAKRDVSNLKSAEDIGERCVGSVQAEEILAINEALARLERMDPQQAQVVQLRYFGGFSERETADALAISQRTVEREWAVAKAWLHAELSERRLQ